MKSGIVIVGLVVVLATLAGVRAYYSRWILYRDALVVFKGRRPSSVIWRPMASSSAAHVLPPQYIITVHYSDSGPRPIDMIEHFQVWQRSSLIPD